VVLRSETAGAVRAAKPSKDFERILLVEAEVERREFPQGLQGEEHAACGGKAVPSLEDARGAIWACVDVFTLW
jgi:hypothetical protein